MRKKTTLVSLESRSSPSEMTSTRLSAWVVKLAYQKKTGRLFAQIGPSVYRATSYHVNSLADQILASNRNRGQDIPYQVISANVRVPRNGRGNKVIINGTSPADEGLVRYLQSQLGSYSPQVAVTKNSEYSQPSTHRSATQQQRDTEFLSAFPVDRESDYTEPDSLSDIRRHIGFRRPFF